MSEKADTLAALPGKALKKTIEWVAMTYEEKRDYVRFYYFWIVQYRNRFLRLNNIEIGRNGEVILDVNRYNELDDMPMQDIVNILSYIGEWKFNITGEEHNGEKIIIQLIENDNFYIGKFYNEVKIYDYHGFKMIGAKDISIDCNGNINSKLILEIDFNIPNNVIYSYLNKLKNIKFSEKPSFFELQNKFFEKNYNMEYEMVKTFSGDTFNHKNFKSRALGIYIYDTLHNNIHDKKCKTVKDSIELLSEDMPDALNILGYGDSELSVFRRLYRKTKECIEKCEVLPMK